MAGAAVFAECELQKNWMKSCLRLVLVMQMLLFLPSVDALEVGGLYEAKVPVAGQTREERLQVYPSALAQVLVKLSGDRSVPEMAQMSAFMQRARSLVQQFHYEELPATEGLVEGGFTRLLVVSFDGNAISQALIEAEVPLWGHTRSEVLVLLAIEDREARYLLAANASVELESSLIKNASRRALPLILPLMDLEDQMTLGFVDVWGDFRHNMLKVSQRYGTEAVLVGRLIRTPEGLWQTRWSLHQGTEAAVSSDYWYVETNTQEEALAEGVDGAADRISRRYAQLFSAASADTVLLTVTEVKDLAGYARAMQYLESLDIVTTVEVSKVLADRVLFKLAIRGDMTGLERAVSLGSTLITAQEAVETIKDDAALGRAFVYQLLP